MGVRENVQPGFQMIWGTAQKNVEAMPETGLEFTPAGLDTRSFRAIAVHMANSCVMFGENVGKSVWERVAPYPIDKPMSRAQVLDVMRDGGARFLAGLARLTDEEAGRIVRTPWGMEMPQGAVMAGQVSHLFYHNGQLSVYLRMQGVKPLFVAL
jgi:uncharacterized damage-inducible protein DinB